MRIIPKNSKVKLTFYKGITIPDMLITLIGLILIAIIVSTNFSFKFYLALIVLSIVVTLLIPITDDKLYIHIAYIMRFIFSRKKYYKYPRFEDEDIETITPYSEVIREFIINKDNTFTGVLRIEPIDFNMLDKEVQDNYIDGVLSRILNNIDITEEYFIVKLEEPLNLDDNLADELKRIEGLIDDKEHGNLTNDEFTSRVDICQSRIEYIDHINSNSYLYSRYYICLCGISKADINTKLDRAVMLLKNNGIIAKRLKDLELYSFIKHQYDFKFDDKDLDKDYFNELNPTEVQFKTLSMKEDNYNVSQIVITGYPLHVPNGWGERLFDMANTKVVMRLKPVEKSKAIKRLDQAIIELKTKETSGKISQIYDDNMHLESLEELLIAIQSANETLFDTTIYISIYDDIGSTKNKKKVKTALREMGFKFDEMIGRQCDFYLSTAISKLERTKISCGIQTSSIAASFPFVSNAIVDKKGIYIGRNNLPVFIDFFKRSSEHVNSNTIIVGQSGFGKSYATKTIISGLATLNTKVYILDPENEYGNLAKSLSGASIDVSNGNYGKINPFQIIAGLESDSSYYEHLQFLEQFFKLILPGISFDALEMLNKLIVDLYKKFNINETTNITNLSNTDYPIFDDLYDLIVDNLMNLTDEYSISCLRILLNYIAKFTNGGRISTLWNGYTTFKPSEAFIAFNFQRLLSSKNDVTGNGQMLLVLKWIENEVIKNRDYNNKYNTDKKIVIAIDEAHLFIDEKYPIALDFMYSLCKRIRKYNGMMLITTQSFKDFTGSSDMMRKSMAIINVSQYSLIFNLPPNDMTDLIKLYENVGGINETEIRTIIHSNMGECLFVSSNQKRTNIKIETTDYVHSLIENNERNN